MQGAGCPNVHRSVIGVLKRSPLEHGYHRSVGYSIHIIFRWSSELNAVLGEKLPDTYYIRFLDSGLWFMICILQSGPSHKPDRINPESALRRLL